MKGLCHIQQEFHYLCSLPVLEKIQMHCFASLSSKSQQLCIKQFNYAGIILVYKLQKYDAGTKSLFFQLNMRNHLCGVPLRSVVHYLETQSK
jgi:hypothetical protein